MYRLLSTGSLESLRGFPQNTDSYAPATEILIKLDALPEEIMRFPTLREHVYQVMGEKGPKIAVTLKLNQRLECLSRGRRSSRHVNQMLKKCEELTNTL